MATKEKKDWGFPVRRFKCPPDLFGDDRFIIRKRYMKIKVAREIRSIETEDKLFDKLAEYILAWNLESIDDDGNRTGEALPQPYQNPRVFEELDCLEQLPWIVQALFASPPNFQRGR